MSRPKKHPEPDSESSSDDPRSSDDEYHPNSALPVLLERPSTKPPTPNRYRIITRELSDHGEGSYILQPLSSTPNGGSKARNGNIASASKTVSKPKSKSKPTSTSNSKFSTPAGSTKDAKRTLLRVPLTGIYNYVSQAQLETFEHHLARNPLLDPYMRRLFQRSQAEYDFLSARHAAKLGPGPKVAHGQGLQLGEEGGQMVLPERKRVGRPPKRPRTGVSPMERVEVETQIRAELARSVDRGREVSSQEDRDEDGDEGLEVVDDMDMEPLIIVQSPLSTRSQPVQQDRRSSLLHPLPYSPPPDPEEDGMEVKPDEEETWEVEGILEDAVIDGEHCFLVKWVGFSEDDATWEQQSNLGGAMELVEEYLRVRRDESGGREESSEGLFVTP